MCTFLFFSSTSVLVYDLINKLKFEHRKIVKRLITSNHRRVNVFLHFVNFIYLKKPQGYFKKAFQNPLGFCCFNLFLK